MGEHVVLVVDDVPPVEAELVGALQLPVHVDVAVDRLVDGLPGPRVELVLVEQQAVAADVPEVADEEGEVAVPEVDVADVPLRVARRAVGVPLLVRREHAQQLRVLLAVLGRPVDAGVLELDDRAELADRVPLHQPVRLPVDAVQPLADLEALVLLVELELRPLDVVEEEGGALAHRPHVRRLVADAAEAHVHANREQVVLAESALLAAVAQVLPRVPAVHRAHQRAVLADGDPDVEVAFRAEAGGARDAAAAVLRRALVADARLVRLALVLVGEPRARHQLLLKGRRVVVPLFVQLVVGGVAAALDGVDLLAVDDLLLGAVELRDVLVVVGLRREGGEV